MAIALAVGAGLAVLYATTRGPSNLVWVQSTTNNRKYLVQDLSTKQDAANRMATIHENIETLFRRYRDNPATASEPRIQTMITRFDPSKLVEANMTDSTTSYSEGKGEQIVLCLRQKTKGYPFADLNTTMFVVLHEIAHLMTYSIGHTPEFWANFRRILNDAVASGIYTNVNYGHSPSVYCGLEINSTPLA